MQEKRRLKYTQTSLFPAEGIPVQGLPENIKAEIIEAIKMFIIDMWHRKTSKGETENG